MPRVSATISNETELLLSGAVKAGIYTGKSDAVRDAVRSLVNEQPELVNKLAVELYRRDEIDLLTVTRLAQVSETELREMLEQDGEI
jgi:Arc/MetJ-type ribon-helix-helix transcriptional regulator